MNHETEVALERMFNSDVSWRNSSLERLQRLLGQPRTRKSALAQLADELEEEYALMWEFSASIERNPALFEQLKTAQSLKAGCVDWMVIAQRLYLELSLDS